jgi:adhesin transport system outer membrane protein
MRLWHRVIIGMSAGMLFGSSSTALAVTLGDVAREAAATNPIIRAAEANAKARNYEVYQAMGQYLPQITARAAGGREQSENPIVRSIPKDSVTLNRTEFSVTATQLIVDGWGVGSSIRERQYDSRSAKYDFKGSYNSVLLAVAEAFMNVKRQREALEIAKNNVAAHQETLRKVRLSYSGGAGTRADVGLGQSRLARAQAEQANSQINLDDAISRYCTLTGQSPPADLAMPEQPRRMLPNTLYGAVKIAMNNNPVVLSSINTADAASAHVGVVRSRFFPRVDAQFTARADNNLGGVEASDGSLSGMAVMTYDIISGGTDLAAFYSANADRLKAQSKSQDLQRQVRERVRAAWAELVNGREEVTHYGENVKSQAQVVDDYRKQFSLGQRQLFNVLDAQDDLFTAQNSYIKAKFDTAIAYYRVLESIGALNLQMLN